MKAPRPAVWSVRRWVGRPGETPRAVLVRSCLGRHRRHPRPRQRRHRAGVALKTKKKKKKRLFESSVAVHLWSASSTPRLPRSTGPAASADALTLLTEAGGRQATPSALPSPSGPTHLSSQSTRGGSAPSRSQTCAHLRFTLINPCRTPVDHVIASNIDPIDIDIALFASFGFAVDF